MVDRYVDPVNGNDAWDGLAPFLGGGHGPKATANGVEDTPVVAGDVLHFRAGVYRELWTWDVSGGNAYTTGTVTVTNGSTTVQGAGTLWLANVAANYMFHCTIFATAADGVTNGTATFTSAAGNFQAAMIGYVIQINTKGAYKIANVGAANSITLSDPNGLGWPGAAVGLSYSVMSGMEPFDVLSVDGNTQLTLTAPWYGPTLTGLAYITYNPIRAIGDVTGQIWGVGGTVRITGSDDDITLTRANCIVTGANSYRVLRGFSIDLASSHLLNGAGPSYITIEDCSFQLTNTSTNCINISAATQAAITIRRCMSLGIVPSASFGFAFFSHTVAVNSAAHLISNCRIIGATGISSTRVGGIAVRNSTFLANNNAIRVVTALTVGQSILVFNNLIQSATTTGLIATNIGEITPNYNAISRCGVAYSNVTAGANDNTHPALFALPLLSAGQAGVSGFRLPPLMLGELSQWSQVKALTGFGEAPADILGIKRPVTSAKNSWGAVQYQNQLRDTATVRSGAASLKFVDAGRQQIFIPVTNVSTTIRVYCYREANYAGTNPQMIIKQSGQADIIITDVGAAGIWNLLTTTFMPAAIPTWLVVELVSNNTAAAGVYAVYFDDLIVS